MHIFCLGCLSWNVHSSKLYISKEMNVAFNLVRSLAVFSGGTSECQIPNLKIKENKNEFKKFMKFVKYVL